MEGEREREGGSEPGRGVDGMERDKEGKTHDTTVKSAEMLIVTLRVQR